MAIHLPPAGGRLIVEIGVGVELAEPVLHFEQAGGEHEGLVAVITGADVARPEGAGHGQLGELFAVAEDAEFGFAGEHFLAADQAHMAAQPAEVVVVKDVVGLEVDRHVTGQSEGVSSLERRISPWIEVGEDAFSVGRVRALGWHRRLALTGQRLRSGALARRHPTRSVVGAGGPLLACQRLVESPGSGRAEHNTIARGGVFWHLRPNRRHDAFRLHQ